MPVISGDGLMIISLLSNSCTLIGVSFPLIFSNFTPLTRTWCIYFIYIWNRRADVSIQKCQIKQTQLIIKVFFISAHILIKCLRICMTSKKGDLIIPSSIYRILNKILMPCGKHKTAAETNCWYVKLLSPMFHFDRSQNPINVIDAPIMRGCDRQLNSIKRFFLWMANC